MNSSKDKISLLCKASLGQSKTKLTHLDHQQGSEVHGQGSCMDQKNKNSPLEWEDCMDGNPELQAEPGCPTTQV